MRRLLSILVLVAAAAAAQEGAPPAGGATPQEPATPPTSAPTPAPSPGPAPAETKPPEESATPSAPPARPAPAPAAPKPAAPKPTATPSAPAAQTPVPRAPAAVDPRGTTLPLGTPEPDQIRNLAKLYFQHLLQSDARQLVAMSAYPFYLEGQRVDGAEPLFQQWLTNLRAKRTDLISLYGLEVYTAEQMEAQHGPPPARLSSVPLRGKTYIVVANLSGRAAVAVFREVDTMWKVVAYTD